jgi:hypothetical protein
MLARLPDIYVLKNVNGKINAGPAGTFTDG